MVKSIKEPPGGSKEIARGPEPANKPPPEKKAPLAKGEEFVVIGKVIDRESREPVSGAAYVLSDPKGNRLEEGKTDHTGTFMKPVTEAGSYPVEVSPPSGAPAKKPLPAVPAGAKSKEPVVIEVEGGTVVEIDTLVLKAKEAEETVIEIDTLVLKAKEPEETVVEIDTLVLRAKEKR